jgi:hypothetical protein
MRAPGGPAGSEVSLIVAACEKLTGNDIQGSAGIHAKLGIVRGPTSKLQGLSPSAICAPANFSIIAVDRVDLTDEKLRRRFHDGVRKFSRQGNAKTAEWGEFARHIRYQQGDFKKLQTYTVLGEECAKLEKQWGASVHRIFSMATPPSMFGEIPKYLGKAGGG